MTGRRRVSAALLLAGGLGAIVAGLVQATIGSRIPSWTGNKADPGALGLLTVGFGAVVIVAARSLTARRRSPTTTMVAGTVTVLIAVIGATTVGRLWFLPGALLVVGLFLAVDDWGSLRAWLRRQWCQVLLVLLGACELVMAIHTGPLVALAGVVAGAALVAAATVAAGARRTMVLLVVVGTVPFAVMTWTALVPVLVCIVAVPIALAVHAGVPAIRAAR
ncbi:MAG: hypothetical protein ABW195_05520 [Ilumatobacteraceae bacterium]